VALRRGRSASGRRLCLRWFICGGGRCGLGGGAETGGGGNSGSAGRFGRGRGAATGECSIRAVAPLAAALFGLAGITSGGGRFLGVQPPPHNTYQYSEQNDQEESFHGKPFGRLARSLALTLRRVHSAVQHFDRPGRPFWASRRRWRPWRGTRDGSVGFKAGDSVSWTTATIEPIDAHLNIRDDSPLSDRNNPDFALNRGFAVVEPPRGAIEFPL
jgi:hypothetical protein